MKKFLILAGTLLLTNVVHAEKNSAVWNPPPFPPNPPDVPRTVFPAPRADWVARALNNINAAAAKGKDIKLVFDGDSITDGWQGAGKNVWAERYAKFGAFDFGIGGDQTQHLLWRLSQGQAEGLQPKLIALMIGTNNIGNESADIVAGVTAIVREYRKICPDAVILLQGIFPRAQKADDPVRAKIKGINAELAKLDDGEHVIFTDFGDKFLAADGELPRDVMHDALHPNEKGYQIWADAIQPYIDKYLK